MPRQKDWSTDHKKNKNRDTFNPHHQPANGLKRLKRLGKSGHLKRLKSPFNFLDGIGGAIKFEENLPDALLGAVDGVVHLDDPQVQDWLSRLDTKTQDDQNMVKRCVQLKNTRFQGSPFTELIVYDWFSRNGVQFDYQVPIAGGRQTKLGQVLDFAVYSGGTAIALPVQGQYWHTRPDVAASDELDKLAALGQYVNGRQIDRYVPVWERQLYRNRDNVLSFAISNVAIGP